MKNKSIIVGVLSFSAVLQHYVDISFQKEFISTLLTVFAIFFGFYVTSFTVFATSKYIQILYQIEDESDNRKTLLDTLLGKFTFATYVLLFSIVCLVSLYLLMENNKEELVSYFAHILWGILFLNILYLSQSISVFIKITRQSTKEN